MMFRKKEPIMRKYFHNRLIQCVLILVILCGAILFSIREHWQSPPDAPSAQVSKTPIAQQTPPAVLPAPQPVPPDAQPAVKKSFPVGAMPGIVSPDRLPKSFPPAATVTLPVIPEEARLENRIAEMDAFTAAKYLHDLQEAGTGVRMRALAAQAYAENPDDFEVVEFWAHLNRANPWRGSNPEGIAARRKLLEMRPNSPAVLLKLSAALWYTEPEEALGHLEKVEKLIGPDDWIMALKAKAYERMGRAETALAVLKTYREKHPIRPPMELTPLITVVGPNFLDFHIEASEEVKPLVGPNPRYLEAPPGKAGG